MLKNYKSFDLLDDYLTYLTVIKGRSHNAVIEYLTDILMFLEYLCNKNDNKRDRYDLSMIDGDFLKEITLVEIYNFISNCQTEKSASV